MTGAGGRVGWPVLPPAGHLPGSRGSCLWGPGLSVPGHSLTVHPGGGGAREKQAGTLERGRTFSNMMLLTSVLSLINILLQFEGQHNEEKAMSTAPPRTVDWTTGRHLLGKGRGGDARGWRGGLRVGGGASRSALPVSALLKLAWLDIHPPARGNVQARDSGDLPPATSWGLSLLPPCSQSPLLRVPATEQSQPRFSVRRFHFPGAS